MKVFFDVDLTILCSTDEGWQLRPGTQEVIRQLAEMGHQVYIWTASGKPHAEQVVQTYGLGQWVVDCMDKDSGPPITPDMIVDDDEFLVQKYSGVWVKPYREPDPEDRQLFQVLEAVKAFGDDGDNPGTPD